MSRSGFPGAALTGTPLLLLRPVRGVADEFAVPVGSRLCYPPLRLARQLSLEPALGLTETRTMADRLPNEEGLRAVRDVLRAQLAILDRHGEAEAAIEINAGIEILNRRLGEPTTDEEIEAIRRRFLSD